MYRVQLLEQQMAGPCIGSPRFKRVRYNGPRSLAGISVAGSEGYLVRLCPHGCCTRMRPIRGLTPVDNPETNLQCGEEACWMQSFLIILGSKGFLGTKLDMPVPSDADDMGPFFLRSLVTGRQPRILPFVIGDLACRWAGMEQFV